jgi:uncharacterized membrane protein YtjA (UPF0391 family)
MVDQALARYGTVTEVRPRIAFPCLHVRNTRFHGGVMLRWSALFLVIAIIAAVFGFGGIALAAAGIAKILFFVFLVLFLISLISGVAFRRRV